LCQSNCKASQKNKQKKTFRPGHRSYLFFSSFAARRPGDTMTLTVRRDGGDVVLPVTFPRAGGGDGAPAG